MKLSKKYKETNQTHDIKIRQFISIKITRILSNKKINSTISLTKLLELDRNNH